MPCKPIELIRTHTSCYTLYNVCILFQSKLHKFCMWRGNKLVEFRNIHFPTLSTSHIACLLSTTQLELLLQIDTSLCRYKGGPKEQRAKRIWPRETHSVTYVPGLSTLSDLSLIDAQLPPLFLCCPMPPSHHPA